jgi:RNA polymerase sigma factor (sigma-70 family)
MFEYGSGEHTRGPIDVGELLAGALRGEQRAWTALVERFLPLVRATAFGYRLSERDVEDIGQTVWLRLLENLQRIREPRALPAWLVTTTRHESLRLLRGARRTVVVDPLDNPALDVEPDPDDDLDVDILRVEQARVLVDGLAELPATQRALLMLLTGEQVFSYREISALLRMPVGSIGPTRARGLARLRRVPAVREYLFSDGDCALQHAHPA